MMPRQQSIGSNTSNSNSNNNNSMNVSAHSNMNYTARGGGGGGGGGNSGAGKSPSGDHIRNRYSHHGGGGGGDSASGGGGGGGASSSSGGGGQSAASAAAMGDYSGLQNHQFPLSHSVAGRASGLPAGLGSFNPGGMNAAAMNPSLYPHLGQAGAAAALSQHQSQQASLGEHLDYRNGGNSGASANPSSQAEREEELLLNLLIARRQRQAMRGGEPQQMGPAGSGGGGNSTSWTDDWMRLRQQQEQLGVSAGGEHNPYEGLPSSLQSGGDSSRRASGRMSLGTAAGMNQLQNMNLSSNMNMSGAGAASQRQFLQENSRLQNQRGSGMGLQMGSPQGSWAGGNAAAVANMHQHQGMQMNDSVNAYAHQRSEMGMVSNTQVELDVLQRVDPMMRPNMMYDARMAEQGGMGQNPYGQYPMGRPHGQAHLHDRSLGYGKRQLEAQGIKGMDKHVNPQHAMQQLFASPQKQGPPEDVPPTKKRRPHKKKPADMPRRPLSAYNLFFSEERERILKEIEGKTGDDDKKDSDKAGEDESKPKALLRPLLPSEKKRRPHRKTHGKISFQELATKVGQRWKALPDDRRKYYQDLAQEDMKRQKKAMEEYYQKRSALTASDASTKE